MIGAEAVAVAGTSQAIAYSNCLARVTMRTDDLGHGLLARSPMGVGVLRNWQIVTFLSASFGVSRVSSTRTMNRPSVKTFDLGLIGRVMRLEHVQVGLVRDRFGSGSLRVLESCGGPIIGT